MYDYRLMLGLILLACQTLMGNIVHQEPTTPEFEEELVFKLTNEPCTPFSEALKALISGISDQTFNTALFDKIREKEKEQYSGDFVDYWDTEKIKIKATFLNGKVNGHVHGWFPDGNEAFKAFYHENIKVGVHMAFFPKGGPKIANQAVARILCFDFSGKLDRSQTSEYQNGRLKTHISFKHGLLDGKLQLYKKNGSLTKACEYKLKDPEEIVFIK